MYKGCIQAALALTLVFVLIGFAPAGAESYGVVTSDSLRLRALPTTESRSMGAFSTGTSVELRGYVDGWYWVRVGDDTGYMSAQYVRRATPGFVSNRGKYVNLRAEPSYRAEVLMQAQSWKPLAVLARRGDFYRVAVAGRVGFMDAKFVELEQDEIETDVDMYQWIVGSDAIVRQFGQEESRIEYADDFTMNVQYPHTDCIALDAALTAYVSDKEREARDMVAQAREVGDGASVEFALTYDAYRIGKRYETVLENGWLLSSYMAHQEDLVLAVTVDLETGRLLTADDILTPEGKQTAVDLLSARLAHVYGASDAAGADESWLAHSALMPSGLAVILKRGDLLPSFLGSLRVILPYAELRAAGALAPGLDVAGAKEAKISVDTFDVTREDQAEKTPGKAPGEAERGARRIDPSRPMIALTFDDGPSEETPRILAALDEADGRATFCVIGNRVSNYAEVLRQIAQQGSEIACHTWSHKKLTNLSQGGIQRELERTAAAVGQITDVPVRVLRPPYGSVNKDVRAVTRSMDMVIASWSVDTLDWRTRNANSTYRAIMKGAQNGAVILCHDLYESTADAIARAIPELTAQGYQLVTFSELMSFHKNGVKTGTVYSHLAPENIVTP